MNFRCDTCGRCCRHHRVPVTIADLRRLDDAGIPVAEALELLGPDEVDVIGEPESLAVVREGRRLLVLRHAPFAACLFLDEGNRCGVYEARPTACRTYPFVLAERETKSSLAIFSEAICPEETGLRALSDPEKKSSGPNEESVRRDLTLLARELREQVETVTRWNRAQRNRLLLRRPARSGDDFLREIVATVRRRSPEA